MFAKDGNINIPPINGTWFLGVGTYAVGTIVFMESYKKTSSPYLA